MLKRLILMIILVLVIGGIFPAILPATKASFLDPATYAEQSKCDVGDINCDGSVNIADVVYLFKHYNNIPVQDGDINCDGSVNIADVVYLFVHLSDMSRPVVFARYFKITFFNKKGFIVNDFNNADYVLVVLIDPTTGSPTQKILVDWGNNGKPSWADSDWDYFVAGKTKFAVLDTNIPAINNKVRDLRSLNDGLSTVEDTYNVLNRVYKVFTSSEDLEDLLGDILEENVVTSASVVSREATLETEKELALPTVYSSHFPNPFSIVATLAPPNYNLTHILVAASPLVIWESPILLYLYNYSKLNVGSISTIYYPSQINWELLIEKNPQVVFVPEWAVGDAYKAENMGFKVIRYYTWAEPTYLGSLEWIKFAAVFFGKDVYKIANRYFQYAWRVVMDMKRKQLSLSDHPPFAVVIEDNISSFDNSVDEYIPKHNQYLVHLMEVDLGGTYIFDRQGYTQGYGIVSIDRETLLTRIDDSRAHILIDIYPVHYMTRSLAEAIASRYSAKILKLYIYVTKPAFWQGLAYDPVGIYADFLKILYPHTFKGKLKYFWCISPDGTIC